MYEKLEVSSDTLRDAESEDGSSIVWMMAMEDQGIALILGADGCVKE